MKWKLWWNYQLNESAIKIATEVKNVMEVANENITEMNFAMK